VKVVNLASGSKGNCSYIFTNSTHILVDVGVSFDEIEKKLSSFGEDVFNVDAIIITHEHADHIKGLATFLRKKNDVKIYAHPKTMLKLLERVGIPVACQVFITSENFYIGDFLVSAFSLSHDASHCLGFSFFENGKKFSIATDVGFISDSLEKNLEGSDFIFLESNYDPDLLYYCEKYPIRIRERIMSNIGHLSNEDCARLVDLLIRKGTTRFALAHISENTNSQAIALKTVLKHLTNIGVNLDNINVDVLDQYKMSKIFEV